MINGLNTGVKNEGCQGQKLKSGRVGAMTKRHCTMKIIYIEAFVFTKLMTLSGSG